MAGGAGRIMRLRKCARNPSYLAAVAIGLSDSDLPLPFEFIIDGPPVSRQHADKSASVSGKKKYGALPNKSACGRAAGY